MAVAAAAEGRPKIFHAGTGWTATVVAADTVRLVKRTVRGTSTVKGSSQQQCSIQHANLTVIYHCSLNVITIAEIARRWR